MDLRDWLRDERWHALALALLALLLLLGAVALTALLLGGFSALKL